MAERENKKFERNLGKATDLRDNRVRNAVELRKNAQDERLKKGRAVTEASSPLAAVQPMAAQGMGAAMSASAIAADPSAAAGVVVPAAVRPQPSVAEIPSLFMNIQSHDPSVVLEATRGFRRLLSLQKDPPITEVVETGVVPIFVGFLEHDRMPELQFEAAWALTNVASGTSVHTRAVTDAGAIPVFVRLLQSVHDNVKEQAVWALGNIAGDSVACRDRVLAANAMAPLLSVLETTGTHKQSLLRNATWTLSNFCRGKPAPGLDLIAPALPTMARLVLCQDSEVLSDVCWAMSYVSDGDEQRIDALLRNVPIEYLVQLISSREDLVQTPALRTIGNIVTGNDEQTDRVIRAGALPLLRQMLFHHKKSLRKEACWSLSNVTAGTPAQVAAVIACDIIPPVVNLLAVDDFEVQKEAAWCISNATCSSDPTHIEHLVQCNCLRPMVELLSKGDARTSKVLLEAMRNILKSGSTRLDASGNNPYLLAFEQAGGIDAVELLQHDKSQKVMRLAQDILENYIGVESEDEDAGVAPQSFSFPAGNAGGASYNFDGDASM